MKKLIKVIFIIIPTMFIVSACTPDKVTSSKPLTPTGVVNQMTPQVTYSFDDQLACEYFDKKSNNYEDSLDRFWNVYLKAMFSDIPGFAEGAEMLHDGYDTNGLNSEAVWKKGHSIVFDVCYLKVPSL